jgi:hypothetical protein
MENTIQQATTKRKEKSEPVENQLVALLLNRYGGAEMRQAEPSMSSKGISASQGDLKAVHEKIDSLFLGGQLHENEALKAIELADDPQLLPKMLSLPPALFSIWLKSQILSTPSLG